MVDDEMALDERPWASMASCGFSGGLTTEDLLRLEPLVLASLNRLIPCSRIRMMPADHFPSLPRPEGMSERQHARAIKALEAGLPFFDRIGRFLVLPCPLASGRKEVFLFEGVTPSIGVDEAARWLPVLAEHVPLRLMEIKQGALSAIDGLPPYCVHTIRHACSRRLGPFCIIEVGRPGEYGPGRRQMSTMRPEFVCLSIGDVLKCVVEWIGTAGGVSWFALEGADPHRVRMALRLMTYRQREFPAFRKRVLIHLIEPGEGLESILAEMESVRAWASLTGSRVFATHDARDLSERLGMPDPSAWGELERDLTLRRASAVAYVYPLPPGMDVQGGKECKVFRVGPSSAFIVAGSNPFGKDLGKTWEEWLRDHVVKRMPEAPNIGMAVRRLLPAGLRDPFLGAVFAFLHAHLLGNGACVMFDDITANVLGDEYYAWGDVKGARRIYAIGVRMNTGNQRLLNSLGVACAELGFKKAAMDAFERASLLAPEAYMAFYNLAGVHFATGRLDRAEAAARKAIEMRPGDPLLVMRLAEVLVEAGREREAEGLLEGIEGVSEVPVAWYRLKGRILFARPERWKDAKSALQEALKRNPADAEAMALMALGFLDREGDRQTAEMLSQACRQSSAWRQKNGVFHWLDQALSPPRGLTSKKRPC